MVPVAKKPTLPTKRTLRSTTRAQIKPKLESKNAFDERINATAEQSEQPSTSMVSTRSTKAKLTKKRKEVAKRPDSKQVKRSQTKQLLINNNNNSNGNNNNYNTKNNNSNNNNNNKSLLMEPLPMKRYKLLKAFCMQVAKSNGEPQQPAADTGYTQQQLQQFLSNSTLGKILPASLIFASPSCAQHLRQLVRLIDALDVVQLEELLDLYHLAIAMQNYEQLYTTHSQGQRCELLHAVSSLAAQLQPEYIEYMAICLCDRLVIGAGKERMQRVLDMHGALVQLIADSDVSRRIALTILLATIAKISRLELSTRNTRDILALAFDMVKRVDWMRLVVDGCQPDIFALLRSFALIINTHQNGFAHSLQDVGTEIRNFFMQLLRILHISSKHNNLIMMMERFIVFCILRGATASCRSTHVFDTGSQSSS